MINNKKWGTFNLRLNQKSFIVSSLFFTYLVSVAICEHELKGSLEPIQVSTIANQNQSTSFEINELKWNHPLLAVFFISLSIVTVSGNILVICAVIREPCLKTATNYYIISLAVADLLVGCVVAPFNGLIQMTFGYWFFGQFWCDMLYSFDVFASTASILSLLMIALDRYAAVSDPIQYHYCWIRRYWALSIAGIWICSACISFPAIAYWRYVAILYKENQCLFTDDIYYIIFSSLISFYIPLIVMIVVYIRIYMTALIQVNALRIGHKRNVRSSDGTHVSLRIHRGGYHGVDLNNEKSTNQCNMERMSIKNKGKVNALKDDFFTKRKISTKDIYDTAEKYLETQKKSTKQRRNSCDSKINCEKVRPHSSIMLKLAEEQKNLNILMNSALRRSSSLIEANGVVQFLYYPSMSKEYNYNERKQSKSFKNFSFEKEFRKSMNSKENYYPSRQLETGYQYKIEESTEFKSTVKVYSENLKSKSRRFSISTNPNNLSRLPSITTTCFDNDETLSFISKQYSHSYLRSGARGQCHSDSSLNSENIEDSQSVKPLEFYRQHYQDHLKYQRIHLPMTFPSVLWDFIKFKLLRKNQALEKTTNEPVTDSSNGRKSIFSRLTGARNKFSHFSREQKAAKTLGIVMGVFIICWMPFFSLNVMTSIFKTKLSGGGHDIIFAIFTWLGYFNSGCNPVIYAFNSRDFRRAFFKILCPTKFRKHKRKQMRAISNSTAPECLNSAVAKLHLKIDKKTNQLKSDYQSCKICNIYKEKSHQTKKRENSSLATNKKSKANISLIYGISKLDNNCKPLKKNYVVLDKAGNNSKDLCTSKVTDQSKTNHNFSNSNLIDKVLSNYSYIKTTETNIPITTEGTKTDIYKCLQNHSNTKSFQGIFDTSTSEEPSKHICQIRRGAQPSAITCHNKKSRNAENNQCI